MKSDNENLLNAIKRVEQKIDDLNIRLDNHIGFIERTYSDLQKPIDMAKRFLGRGRKK